MLEVRASIHVGDAGSEPFRPVSRFCASMPFSNVSAVTCFEESAGTSSRGVPPGRVKGKVFLPVIENALQQQRRAVLRRRPPVVIAPVEPVGAGERPPISPTETVVVLGNRDQQAVRSGAMVGSELGDLGLHGIQRGIRLTLAPGLGQGPLAVARGETVRGRNRLSIQSGPTARRRPARPGCQRVAGNAEFCRRDV